MTRKCLHYFFAFLYILINIGQLHADQQGECPALPDSVAQDKKPAITRRKRKQKKNIAFRYEQTDLVDIINQLAAEKNVNVVMPPKESPNAIKDKVTLNIPYKMTLDEAWDLLTTILTAAGYNFVPNGDTFRVTRLTKEIAREPLPIFVGVPPQDLEPSEQYARYLYYMSNIKVGDSNDELSALLPELLPDNASFKVDSATNAVIIVAPLISIKSAMNVIQQIDKIDFHETLEIISLQHTSADTIASLFQSILKTEDGQLNRYRLDARRANEANYFSKQVKVIAENRLNKLIVLGRSQAVERVKDFIRTYLDVELDSGQSILHVYTLQYLDAESAAETLKNVVMSQAKAGTGQSTGEGTKTSGPERFFDSNIVIKTDRPKDAAASAGGSYNQAQDVTAYQGGNKLIIAARNDDWKKIKKLLDELDTPQPQVLLEVLIADLTLDDTRALGSLIRNPAKIPLPNNMAFQAANLTPGVITNQWGTATMPDAQSIGYIEKPKEIATDLLREGFSSDGTRTDDGTRSAASFQPAGSTVISLNDNSGKTWGIIQTIKLYDITKIVSHPHLIATHNRSSVISVGEKRYVVGHVLDQQFQPVIAQTPIDAKLTLTLTPRISSGDVVNIQIDIDINEFTAGPNTANQRVTRNIVTNANVHDGDILALGGLIRENNQQSMRETPFLSKIPILGWFFKGRDADQRKSNLTIFISPTIISPRLRKGVGRYTSDYAQAAKDYAQTGIIFSNLREPITRWFFGGVQDAAQAIDEFIARDQFKGNDPELEPTKPLKERVDETNENVEIVEEFAQLDKKKIADELRNLMHTDTTFDGKLKSLNKKVIAHLQ